MSECQSEEESSECLSEEESSECHQNRKQTLQEWKEQPDTGVPQDPAVTALWDEAFRAKEKMKLLKEKAKKAEEKSEIAKKEAEIAKKEAEIAAKRSSILNEMTKWSGEVEGAEHSPRDPPRSRAGAWRRPRF